MKSRGGRLRTGQLWLIKVKEWIDGKLLVLLLGNSHHIKTNLIKKTNAKILLVEDQLLSQKIICFYLTNEFNCRVEQATTALSALSLTRDNKYDLIFMDIGLPDNCGINAAKKIHTQSAKKNHLTPIVALTAHASLQDKHACNQAGMADFVNKPISINDLKQVLYQQLLC